LASPAVFASIYTIEKNQKLRFTRMNTVRAEKAAHFQLHRPVDGPQVNDSKEVIVA
jgi:hypothetical protein